jgi:hypothetical protein
MVCSSDEELIRRKPMADKIVRYSHIAAERRNEAFHPGAWTRWAAGDPISKKMSGEYATPGMQQQAFFWHKPMARRLIRYAPIGNAERRDGHSTQERGTR